MSVHHQDPWLTVHVGDCRAVLATMEAESVHTVVTSPPYWGLRDYGAEGQLGLEPTPEQYVENMVAVFREVRRVLRSDGTLWLNLGDSYAGGGQTGRNDGGRPEKGKGWAEYDIKRTKVRRDDGLKPKDLVGIPWRVAFALQADGWYLRSDIIWSKPNPMPESVTDRPTKAHEYLFLLAKSSSYYFDADAVREGFADERMGASGARSLNYSEGSGRNDTLGGDGKRGLGVSPAAAGRNIRSVWTIATQPYPGAHFATFPPKLVEPCILAGTSERGVCPECGAPWRRVVEYQRNGKDWRSGDRLAKGRGAEQRQPDVPRTTTGWQPTCTHDACAVCDNVPNARATNVPTVQPDVSARPPEAAALLDRVRQPGEDGAVEDGAPLPRVRGVLHADEAGRGLLFPDLREHGDGEDPADDQGVRGQPEGLHPSLPAEASDGDADRLRGGASTRDGGDAGPDVGAVGGGGPHQRRQERQPAGEPAGADEADARSHLQPGSGSDDDMPGVRAPLPAARTCDKCGGERTPLAPVPAVVLDVFGGSGTTAMVAQHLSRRAVLIDLNPDYIDQQLKRNQAMPLGLEAA